MADVLLIVVGLFFGVGLGYTIGAVCGRNAGYENGWYDAVLYRTATRIHREVFGEGERDESN